MNAGTVNGKKGIDPILQSLKAKGQQFGKQGVLAPGQVASITALHPLITDNSAPSVQQLPH